MMEKIDNFKIFAAMAILLVSACCLYYNILYKVTPHLIVKRTFKGINGWSSKDVVYDPNVQKILSPDNIVFKQYRKEGKLTVTLFIAHYATLEKTDRSHSPEVCFTGQGWEIKKNHVAKIHLNTDKESTVSVNEIFLKHGGSRMISLSWFQTAYEALPYRGLHKISLLINKLVGKLDSNAFVRLTVIVPNDMDIEVASSQLKQFVPGLLPLLMDFLQ